MNLNIWFISTGLYQAKQASKDTIYLPGLIPPGALSVRVRSCLPPVLPGFPGRLTSTFQSLLSQGCTLQNHTEWFPTKEVKYLYSENYRTLKKEIEEATNKWKHIWYPWTGRINVIKMSKAIYRFKAIPIKIPMPYFTDLEQIFQKFTWNQKKKNE